jgi:hypothetical protein
VLRARSTERLLLVAVRRFDNERVAVATTNGIAHPAIDSAERFLAAEARQALAVLGLRRELEQSEKSQRMLAVFATHLLRWLQA